MVGMIAIGAGIIGYWYRKLMWFERHFNRCWFIDDLSRNFGYYRISRIGYHVCNSINGLKRRAKSDRILKVKSAYVFA